MAARAAAEALRAARAAPEPPAERRRMQSRRKTPAPRSSHAGLNRLQSKIASKGARGDSRRGREESTAAPYAAGGPTSGTTATAATVAAAAAQGGGGGDETLAELEGMRREARRVAHRYGEAQQALAVVQSNHAGVLQQLEDAQQRLAQERKAGMALESRARELAAEAEALHELRPALARAQREATRLERENQELLANALKAPEEALRALKDAREAAARHQKERAAAELREADLRQELQELRRRLAPGGGAGGPEAAASAAAAEARTEELALKLAAMELELQAARQQGGADGAAGSTEGVSGESGHVQGLEELHEAVVEQQGEAARLRALLNLERQHSADLAAELEQRDALHSRIVAQLERRLRERPSSGANAATASAPAAPEAGASADKPPEAVGGSSERATQEAEDSDRTALALKLLNVDLSAEDYIPDASGGAGLGGSFVLTVEFLDHDPAVTPAFGAGGADFGAAGLAVLFDLEGEEPDELAQALPAAEIRLQLHRAGRDGGLEAAAEGRVPLLGALQLSGAGQAGNDSALGLDVLLVHPVSHHPAGRVRFSATLTSRAQAVLPQGGLTMLSALATAGKPAEKVGEDFSLEVEPGRLALAPGARIRAGRAARGGNARICVALEVEGAGPPRSTPFTTVEEVDGGSDGAGGVPAREGEGAPGLVVGEPEDAARRFAGGCWAGAQLGGGGLLFEAPGAAGEVPLGARELRVRCCLDAPEPTASTSSLLGQAVVRMDALEALRGAWGAVVLYDGGGDAVGSVSLRAVPRGAAGDGASAPEEAATVWVQGLEAGTGLLADAAVRELFVMFDSESFEEEGDGGDAEGLSTDTVNKKAGWVPLGFRSRPLRLRPGEEGGPRTVSFCLVQRVTEDEFKDLGYAEATLPAPRGLLLSGPVGIGSDAGGPGGMKLDVVDGDSRPVATLFVRLAVERLAL